MEKTDNKGVSPKRRKLSVKKPQKNAGKPKATPKKLKLLITVVNRNKGEYFADLIEGHSVNMQIMCAARGTASSDMLRYLGLYESDKTVIFSVVREDKVKEITDMLEEKFATVRNGKGVAVVVPFSSVIGVLSYGFLSDNRMTVKEDKKND